MDQLSRTFCKKKIFFLPSPTLGNSDRGRSVEGGGGMVGVKEGEGGAVTDEFNLLSCI